MSAAITDVLSEIRSGQGVGLPALAAGFVEHGGGRLINHATLWRWCDRGCKTASGETVKLEHVRFGSRIVSTFDALERFLAAITERPEDATTVRTTGQRDRAAAKADRELAAAGA
jgi:Protein of unknown function (DUF1580)